MLSEGVIFVAVCASPRPQVGNAIKSSLHGAALKSNNKEGARSIQVEITPTSSRISRNAVTSLSIRGHRWKRHGETMKQIELERERERKKSSHNLYSHFYGVIKIEFFLTQEETHTKGERAVFRSLHYSLNAPSHVLPVTVYIRPFQCSLPPFGAALHSRH